MSFKPTRTSLNVTFNLELLRNLQQLVEDVCPVVEVIVLFAHLVQGPGPVVSL